MSKKKSKGGTFNSKETLQPVQHNDVAERKSEVLETQKKQTPQTPTEEEGANVASVSDDSTAETGAKKLKWWEKIGCRLAKNSLERKELRIKTLEDESKEQKEQITTLDATVKNLKGEITSRDAQLAKAEIKAKKEGRESEVQNLLNKLTSQFDEAKDAMTIEDALRQIISALERYKAEISGAKRDTESVKQNAIDEANAKKVQYVNKFNALKVKLEEETNALKTELTKKAEVQKVEADRQMLKAQQLFDEASKRIADIETTDKGELVLKLEQTQASLTEQQNLVAERDKQIGVLEIAKSKAEEQIASLQKDLKNERDAHKATKDECRTKVDGLKVTHMSDLEAKDKAHAEKVSKLNDEHQVEIGKIKVDHGEELKKKDDIHRAEMEKEQAITKTIENALNETISTQKDSIAGLESKLQAETDLLRIEAEQTAERLFDFLKKNEIMVACDEDYKDKVEEKLHDVVYEAKRMNQAIKDMPQAKTPSEWIDTLTEYLVSQIDENTSLLNRVLKYYAMSNVPFMLDAERENGIYFVRKSMTQVYNDVVSLLAQCGITPIIPSAFVENKDEGQYEVAGQFNDIESFCPGNMSEHIDHIERSIGGLAGVIIGITRVGYVIKNEKVIKAQVIIQ